MTNKKEMSQADWTYLVPGVVIPCLKIELETIPAQLFFIMLFMELLLLFYKKNG